MGYVGTGWDDWAGVRVVGVWVREYGMSTRRWGRPGVRVAIGCGGGDVDNPGNWGRT